MQTRVQNIYSIKNAFSLGCDKEQGAADFSYKPDNKEKVGEDKKMSGKMSGKTSGKSSQKSSQIIMSYMKNKPDITTQEIADLMNMSRRNIAKHI
ncbi:MAG: helix-turn-helix domain-containing protein [Bacteroidales bacterium]|nr:helix-turn-helix domain-containing protein [Bacteroidales bacterium]MCF8327833.1 helix-turn-helix domain-containing protein [Bacteroidales bacterium]